MVTYNVSLENKVVLVTGAAGFIGANFIKYMLAQYDDIRIVVLDLLTYAGNLGTIAEDIDNKRCFFVKGDICDRSLVDKLFTDYHFNYVVNFPAEKTKQDIQHGGKESVSTKCQPMKCMEV